MRLVPKSCTLKFFLVIVFISVFYFAFRNVTFRAIYDFLVSDDRIQGKYDAAIIESWLTPKSSMLKIADSLHKLNIVKDLYITHFKYSPGKFYSGGEVPKFIHSILNLYVLEFTQDTSLFQKIPIEPKDPITINLALQTADYLKHKNYKRIIVISESYHSQRSRLAFKKAFEKNGAEIIVIPAEFGITRTNWWKTDAVISTIFSETLKLIYYHFFVL